MRATAAAETVMSTFDVPDWVEEVHRRKFRFAGQVARRTDGRWTREVLEWSATSIRKRGRLVVRWSDSLKKCLNQGSQCSNIFWLTLAEDADSWSSLEDGYVNVVLGR